MERKIIDITPTGHKELADTLIEVDNARYPKAQIVQGRNEQLFIAVPKTVEKEYNLKAGDVVEFSYLNTVSFKVMPKK